jgi:cytoskeleton protein RodZ
MPLKPFGEHLKREREMRGVSLEEISAATRIAPRFLRALEDEQWEQLPGGVFNRGFIRSVAHYLGLDEDSLVAEYALETKGRSDPGVVADPPDEPDREWARILVLIVFVILILVSGWAAVHYLEPKIAARLHKHSGYLVNSEPLQASTPNLATTSASGDAALAGTTATLDLVIQTAKPAVVKVTADGTSIFEGHMDAGQMKRFAARGSLEISSSESSAIVLNLNGQMVSAGGQPGQPSFVSLTSNDLKPAAGGPH